MKKIIPKNLQNLASVCQDSLYIIGGSVRDFLLGYPVGYGADFDICSPMTEEKLLAAAKDCGFEAKSVYRATGTVKLKDAEGVSYEFTRFRSDKYVRGEHRPSETCFTREIALDARRRDFCCNAVYYDVKNHEIVDPLGGAEDIRKRILRTVAPAAKVFGEDGLRLLRLARFAAQLGFAPDEECFEGARANAALIRDIVPERIFEEFAAILISDTKHGETDGPYRGLKILDDTRVLDEIFPELTAGRGMAQPAAFHAYDVLEHSLRAVRYAPPDVRFAALLHDIGKPLCMAQNGNYHGHESVGAELAAGALKRLKAPKALTSETTRLVALHMRDFDLQMRENKVRREIAECYPLLPKLLALKQADYSACKDDVSPAPSARKWQRIAAVMEAEGVPFTLKELAVNGRDALEAGIPAEKVGSVLELLRNECVLDGSKNERNRLITRLKRLAEGE